MHGSVEIEAAWIGRRVVDLPVRGQDHAREPVGRHAREGAIERFEQHCAIGAGTGFDLDQLKHGIALGLLPQRSGHGIGCRGAFADFHAGAAVCDQHRDIGQWIALFLDQ